MLINEGYPAKLIQTNDGFLLYNLYEIQYFIYSLDLNKDEYTISDDKWNGAKRKLVERFEKSSKLEIVINIIKNFEITNPKRKYFSDFEVFLRESKIEDFITGNLDTIFVSTIHKAKGKEFDNVYLMLNNFKIKEESNKRELYVAMTRAKNNLTIHLNNDIFDDVFGMENVFFKFDNTPYNPQKHIVLQLTHRDIWLDFFIDKNRQKLLKQLHSGEQIIIKNNTAYNSDKQEILKFSKLFSKKLETHQKKGYEIDYAKINFILLWKKEELEKKILIILPEIYMIKANSTMPHKE